MSAYKCIVYATDFSDDSARALPYAVNLAEHDGAELHLLHVKSVLHPYLTPFDLGGVGGIETEWDAAIDRRLQETVPKTSAPVTLAKEQDHKVAPAIARYADKVGADLIVVGSHGHSGLERVLLGSETQSLLGLVHVPVLVVRPNADALDASARPSPFSRILAPVDMSVASRDMLLEADRLAQVYGAEISVLHSVDLPVMPAYFPYAPAENLIPDAQQALANFLADIGLHSPVSPSVTLGPAARNITDAATRSSADLIVIARSGLSGWQRLLIGSVTTRVLQEAHCPVLVLPTPE